MKVTRVNNNFFRVLKDGRKKRIKSVTYFKHCDNDIKMTYQPPTYQPTSILKTEDTYSNPFKKKKVRFNFNNNEVRTYDLSNEEKVDKIMAYNRIKIQNSCYDV